MWPEYDREKMVKQAGCSWIDGIISDVLKPSEVTVVDEY